jgi:UDP-3-O-[3-hydroxymyristoyl] N-acetylglucosamine deacetylase
VPILDGSAASFVFLLQSAGIELQDAPKRFLRSRSVEVREGEGAGAEVGAARPFHGYKLNFEIDFDHPAVDATASRSASTWARAVQARDRARPHLRLHQGRGHDARARPGLGGSMDNVVVVDDYRVLNSDGLRYDDEFVKHKILDAIGDMHVLGHPLLAAYTAFKSRPRAEQQAAARSCWPMQERLRDRHLRG